MYRGPTNKSRNQKEHITGKYWIFWKEEYSGVQKVLTYYLS